MKYLSVTGRFKGAVTKVDNDIYQLFKNYCFNLTKKGYVRSTIKFGNKFLHRLIIPFVPKGFQIDHINRNKLDNRRINLRIVTQSINKLNSNLYNTNKSGYAGISFNKTMNRWIARVGSSTKPLFQASFCTKEEAVKARQEYLKNAN